MLDIFADDSAFGLVQLTDAVNNLIFMPGRLGELGLFDEYSITTTTVVIEQQDGVLKLIGPTPRGGPGHTLPKNNRNLRAAPVPHFEINDAMMAEEVQGVRAFGQDSGLESLMDKVNERGQYAIDSLEVTLEYARVGAIKGIVTYADGSTVNLYDLMGVTAPAEVDFNLDAASDTGALRAAVAQVVRQIAAALQGVPYRGIMAECGDAFFDALISNVEVRNTYKNTPMASVLREGYLLPGSNNKIYGAFEFGGVIWENYRGSVGSTTFINTDKCHLFPIGAPRFFRTAFAPADYNETVNTRGQRRYMKRYEMPNGKGYHLDTQMNAFNYCTRPKALVQGKRT